MVEFEFKAYRRPFSREYRTASDSLRNRSGIIIRLRNEDNQIGFGEVAPVESFATESFVSAVTMCTQLTGEIEYENEICKLERFPCLRFGLDFAFSTIGEDELRPPVSNPWPVCGLVHDIGDLDGIEQLVGEGYRCLKFKIGKDRFSAERLALDRVIDVTGDSMNLRLDANGSLDLKSCREWLSAAAELPVEYLEQPLRKGEEDTMRKLGNDYPTSIALDESVRSVDDLKRWNDVHWPGVYVIKPSLSGGYRSLIAELQTCEPESLVFSSSLETMIGSTASLSVALETGRNDRALGFGVDTLFSDEGISLRLGPFLEPSRLPLLEDFESLWNRI